MTLPTIVKNAQDRFEKSLLSEEIGGVSAYAQFHGWKSYHGQTVQDFLAQEITNAVREVLEEVKTQIGEDMKVDNALNAHDITATVTFNQRMNRVRYVINEILNEKE